jgi:hypothetical protein
MVSKILMLSLKESNYSCLYTVVECRRFFQRESLAAGSFDQLPAPLERILADA